MIFGLVVEGKGGLGGDREGKRGVGGEGKEGGGGKGRGKCGQGNTKWWEQVYSRNGGRWGGGSVVVTS